MSTETPQSVSKTIWDRNNRSDVFELVENVTSGNAPREQEPTYLYLGIEGVIFVPIMTFNILTIITLVKSPSLRNGTSICMISLCFADLNVGLSIVVCAIIDYLPHAMNLTGQTAVCMLCLLLQMASVHGSAFGLLLTAIERFTAIVYPLRYPSIMTISRLRFMVIATWSWVIIINIIPLCFINFSEGMPCYAGVLLPPLVSDLTYIFNSTLPLVVTVVLYLWIAYVARQQQKRITVQESTVGTPATKRDFRILKMMALVLGVYLLCFIPCIIFTFYLVHRLHMDYPNWLVVCFRISLILVLANSFMNPVIYMWKSNTFRCSLKRLCGCQPSDVTNTNTAVDSVNNV